MVGRAIKGTAITPETALTRLNKSVGKLSLLAVDPHAAPRPGPNARAPIRVLASAQAGRLGNIPTL